MELALTQPFFDLQTPDFAWKFVHEASKVLNNLDELKIMLPDNEHQHVICLKALRELQTAVCRSNLAPDYKDKLDNFEKEFNSLREQSDISISLKIHYILDHLLDFFELTGEGFRGVDDHVIECMHQYLNKCAESKQKSGIFDTELG